MAHVIRHRVVPASPEAVWEVLADATCLARWWPRVTRVESVEAIGFTAVLMSKRGRPVRLDLRYTEVEPPATLAWELDTGGSQLDRLLSEWSTRFTLAGEGAATRVRIEERQTFRGSFRTGALLQRRAARRRLDGALDGLATVVAVD